MQPIRPEHETYAQGIGGENKPLTAEQSEVLRDNFDAVSNLPAQGAIKVSEYVVDIDAAKEGVPRLRSNKLHP